MSDHSHAHPPLEHGHSHDAHGPAHGHHHHDEEDTYFINQLCMVGLSGMYGMICLCLWYGQLGMLTNLLIEQFQWYVVISGFALTIFAFVRGGILWRQSADPEFVKAHSHGHDHGHAVAEQAGAACGHEHKLGETCTHDHAHDEPAQREHHIGHAHGHHDHDEADHDHGWAPWRYVVILVPIFLFILHTIGGMEYNAPSVKDLPSEGLIRDFTSIILEALPFIVLGVIIAGFLEEFVPQEAIAKIVPRNRVLAIGIGALLGLVFPMCECGIIVVMKRLLRKGLPLSVCVAYMLAGPVINVIVMTSTFVAFSKYEVFGGPWHVVAWRVGLSYLVACLTALVVDWLWQRHGNRLLHPSVLRGLRQADTEAGNGKRSWGERLNNITQTALNDFVDIMAFLILGAILAAVGKFIIKGTDMQSIIEQNLSVTILLMMGIAILFCLCSEADAFVAANFPLFWPDGSKMAFLVLGPMLDFKLLLMYTRVFKPRLIYTIVLALIVQVFIFTYAAGYFFGKEHPKETQPLILSPEQETYLSSIALGPDVASQLVHIVHSYNPPPTGRGVYIPFKEIMEMATRPDLRAQWKGKTIEAWAMYSPLKDQEHVFHLVRYKMACCASDAVPLPIPVLTRETLTTLKVGDWVRVTAKVDFRPQGSSFFTVLLVSQAKDVERCEPDPSPYVVQ